MAHVQVSGYAWVILTVFLILGFMAVFDIALTIPFLPYFMEDYSLNMMQAGSIVLVSVLTLLYAKPLGDKIMAHLGSSPLKKLMFLAITLEGICCMLYPYAPDFWSLLILRWLTGHGIALVFLCGGGLVVPWLGFQHAGRFGVTQICGLLAGFTAAVYFGGLINGVFFGFDYKSTIFYVTGVGSLVVAIIFGLLAKELPKK